MKKYAKPKMMAKNAPTGSYAAGCKVENSGSNWCAIFKNAGNGCKSCERTK
ncbi:MAG: hypothetical protein IJK43_06425 [Prevotella sp.]|nr:hypothetical protein [Prevotella sp.]